MDINRAKKMNYNNDQPIKEIKKDKLNRVKFVQEIANALILEDDEPCITVSLEGIWGQGKTSVINMIQEIFEGMKEPPIIVHYNPWISGKSDSLVQDFLIQFTSQLNLVDTPEEGKKIAEALLSYSKLFSVAKLIPGVEPWGSLIQDIFSNVGNATKSLSELKTLDIRERKLQVENKLKKLKRPIITIIDDIDRLTPDECFQILRLVKVIANFPRTSFCLAFDPQYLESVLSSNKISNTSEYLDKIIQLRMPLPLITPQDFDLIVEKSISDIEELFDFNYYNDDYNRFKYIYNKHLRTIIKSPREIHRIFNHFRLVKNIVKNEVCTTDLFILSVICIKNNELYNHIKDNHAIYSRRGADSQIMDRSEKVEICQKERICIYNKSLTDSEKNIYESLLHNILPPDSGYSQMFSVGNPDMSGRVEYIDRLTIALHLSIPNGSVSNQIIKQFINGNIDRYEELEKLINSKSIKRFLELFEITSNEEKIAQDEFISLIKIIIESFIEHNLLNGCEILYSSIFSDINHYDVLCRIFHNFLRDSKNKETLIINSINEPMLLPIVSDSLLRLKIQLNKNNEEPWLDHDKFQYVFDMYMNKVKEIMINNTIKSNALEYHIIKSIRFNNEEQALNLIKSINSIKTIDLIRLGWMLIKDIGSTSGKGDYLSVDIEALGKLSIDDHKDKTKRLLEKPILSQEDRAILSSILDGKKHFIVDNSVPRDW